MMRSSSPTSAARPGGKPVVLFLDDDPRVLAALRRAFADEPFQTLAVSTAGQALAAFRHHQVEVIVADERMPDTGGSEFLAEVRQRWPWTGRVILTAYPEEVAATRGCDAGLDLLVQKPWNEEELRRALCRLVRLVKQQRLEAMERPRSEGGGVWQLSPEGGWTMNRLTEEHVVVCVDDEPEVLSALRRTLRNEPYQVLTTVRPEEALRWIESREVSAVLSDLRMPGMTGTELLARVSDRSPSTARIILTAYPAGAGPVPSLRSSIECLIPKPWDDAMLQRAIREFLSEREFP